MAQEFTPEEVAARLTTAGPREFTPEEVAERLGSLTPRPIRSKERSWGDAALDVPAVGLSGVGSLLRVPGQLIKLAPGLQGVGEALEAPGKAIAEFGEGLKSEGLKVREALRSEAISEAEKEGILSEFVTALKYTIKDPALLSSFFIEQLPLLIGPAGAAKAVQIAGMGAVRAAGKGLTGEAAELATKEAAKSLGKRAAGAAVGAGTAMQTADIASETFDRAYDVAIKQGMSKEEANDAALNAARLAAPGAALTSLIATKGLAKLGGAAIERRLAGLPGTGRLRTAGGEAVSEGLEEAGGALAGNIGVRTVDPTQSLTAGVGSAAGLGVLGGGVLGGVLGGKARPELAPGQLEGENLYQTARRLHTEIGELDALAEKAKEQENRQLVELKTDAEVANLYRTEGVEGVERYQKELLQKSVAVEATPEEREQAKQASSAATKLMKQIDTSNVIAHRDLMAMGVSQKDRLYKELIGKDMVADSSPIINSFAKALSRPDLSQQQRENISAALTNINEYVGSGGVDSRNVGESVRRSLGLVGVAPERPAARGVEGTAPAGVAPTEEYAGEPLGRAAVKPSPIGEDIEKAPRAAPTAPITEEVQAPPAAPAAEAVARREPTQATEESAVEKFDPEEVQKARVPDYKSRERLIEMPIDEFLQLADTVTKREPLSFVRQKMDNARDLVRRNVPFSSLPMLMYSDGRVDGHEGRHRALALREAGYKTMPVRLRSPDIRWDRQNDPSDPDYIRQWPTRLQAQENAANPNFSIPFPVKREESARPYEPVKRSLKPETEKRAEEILRQQDEEERQAKQAPETAEPVAEKTRVEQFAEARKDLVNQLDGVLKRILAKYGLKDVKLNINEAMEDEGSYARQIITLALNVDNPVRVLRHESIHALKDMGFFAPAQWNALVKRANEEWIDVLKNTVYNEATGASRYDAYQDLFAAEGANKGLKGDALTKYINESIVEEAIADAFGAYDTGKPPAGMIAATLTRMRKLFKAIKEAFGIVGIDTAEDVFGKIEEGKLKPSSEILETAAKAVKPSVSERVSLAPKGIPKDIWKQHERARLLEEKHFGATEPRQKSAATRSWRTLNKMVTRYAGNDKAALDMMVKMDTISGIREAIADDDGQMLAIYKVTDPELYAQETGLETPKSTAKASLRVMRGEEKPKLKGKPSVNTVGKYFDDQILEEFGRQLDYNNPEDFARAVKIAADEVAYQLKKEKSGLDWYEEDVREAFKQTAKIIPELKKTDNRLLFSVMAGIMSPQTNARDNWFIAAKAFQHYVSTGTIPGMNPENGKLWQGGTQSANKKVQLDFLNKMVEDMGQKKALEWLFSDHTVKEINEFRSKYGNIKSGIDGKLADIKPGLYAFGPKVGPFVSNLNGIHDVTVDKWMTRTFNRYFGTMVDANGEIIDAPTEPQRRAVKQLVNEVAEDAGIKPYQVQSLLWFYEQRLFTEMGVPSPSYGFSDGGKKFFDDARGRGGEPSGGAASEAVEPKRLSLRTFKDLFDKAADIPQSEGVEIIRENWIGGVSGIGERNSAYDLPRVQGGRQYMNDVQDLIRNELGDTFKGYRLMHVDELEEIMSGSMGSDLASFTLLPEVAQKFSSVAALGDIPRDQLAVVEMNLTPEHIWMFGHRGEREVVVNYGEGYSTAEVIATPLEGEKPSLRTPDITQFPPTVRDENFKRWSRNAPLVLAEDALDYNFQDGKPFVAQSYHGTNAEEDFTVFSTDKLGLQTGAESADMGYFSTSSPEVAGSYAANLGVGRALGLATYGSADLKNDPEAKRLLNAVRDAEKASAKAYYDAVDDVINEIRKEGKFDLDELPKDSVRSFAGRFVDQNNYPGYQDRKAKIDAAQQAVDDAGADLTQYIFGYEASKIPQRIMPLYVRMSNPKVYDAEGKSPIEFAISERIREAKKDGHDGIVFKNIADPSPVAVHYVSFNNADLKSAIGNIGTFDEQDDILRSLRSPTNPQFKFWFGNSKVVDENGEPKVMYHGTGKDYEILSTARRAAGAIFVSDEPQFAEKFAKDTFARASAEAATGVGIDDEAFKQGVDKAIAQIRKDYGRDPMGRTLVAEVRKGYNEANAEAQEYLRNAFKDVMPAGPNIIPVYIKSEYPFDYENDEHVAAVRRVSETKLTAEALKTGNWEAIEDNEIQAAIRVLGFDGFYVKEQGKRSLGVYDPNQVKSVFNEAPTERPELRMSLRGSITPQLEKTLNKIVPKTYRPNRFQRILDSISGDGFTAARAQIINRYEALARLDRAVAQQIKQAGGVQQLADQKAESAALFSDLGAGLLETAMGAHDRWGGAPVFRNGMTTISNFGGKIKGPIRIFKPLSDLKDPDAFRMYQLWSSVKRGKRLTVEGRESAIDAADIAVVDAFATNPGNANIVKLFERVQKDWLAYNDALVKFMEDTGVISKAMGKAFTEHGDYFPFYRLANDQDVVGPKMFTSIGNVKPPKKLKGGEAPLGDFFENIVLNSRAAIQAGIKNVASQRATEQALRVQGVVRLASQPTVKQTGANSWDVFDGNLKIGEVDAGSLQDAQLAADRQHKRPSSIQINMYRVMEKGNEVFYRSADPLFIDALKSLNMPDLPFLGALFSGPANLLRNLVTKDPAFMLANMMRDSLAAYVTTGVNMTPVVDTLKNFTVAIAGKSPEMQKLYAAGVLGGYDYSVKSKDAAATFEKRLREVSGAKTIGETLATPFTSLWGALEKGTQASDAATRIEMYKKTLAKTGNEAEAYWQALEVMNFNRHGSNPVIRIMTAAIPFLNARMQGLDLLYRKAIYPIYGKDATDAEIQNMKTFWVRGMTMASLSVLYWMMVHDDEDYKSQEQETRDNYWFVPGLGVKIPIPFEIGVLFKVVPERIAELAWGEDTSKDFRESMTRNLINTFRVNPIPQAVLPLYETIVDKSLYTGRAIVSRGMENIAPEYQIGPNTSRIAEVAGKAVGYSPMKIDHLIRGYTGTLGQYMADLIGAAYEVSADNPKPSKRIEQLPIIRRFATDPEARGKLTAFYELKNAVDEAVRTSNMLEKTMQLEELIKYQEDNAQILAMQDYIKDLDKSLKELRDTRKEILSMPMDPDDKRDTLVSIGQMERMLVDNIKDLRAMAFK